MNAAQAYILNYNLKKSILIQLEYDFHIAVEALLANGCTCCGRRKSFSCPVDRLKNTLACGLNWPVPCTFSKSRILLLAAASARHAPSNGT